MTVTDANRGAAGGAAARAARPRLVVATTYPIHPPLGGGQVRAAQLYGGLTDAYDVELVTLAAAGAPGGRRQIARGIAEHQVPKSDAHAARELELQRAAGTVITDIAFSELHPETPEYVTVLRHAAAGARAVVACHPYAFPAIREATELPVWYEAQDVEASLKRHVLGSSPEARRLLALAEAVERDCCRQAELVLACSAEDRAELIERYGTEPGRVLVVPNGAALDETEFVSPTQRLERKRRLGLEGRFLALFIASWHEPNLVAARELVQLATRVPEVDVMILGGVGLAFVGEALPPNVQVTGIVSAEFKQTVLGIADVALNPVRTGSGTNLKMVEYYASGTPVISTAFGARGLGVRA
ncbi:MAG TPA: glycosyltransferase, partial [Solirubrobacteraceae bacterium]|nr:glycosyltransferase [Solirubrobacteraceae bacterium]